MAFNSAKEIIDDIRLGKMVVLLDDEDRENEGDLVIAAECVTAESINFFTMHARGLVCLTLTEDRCRQLNLPLMVSKNQSQFTTNFTLSIEARDGVTTGISAPDRARTVQAAVAKDAKSTDIVQPGHIFPIMARPGGVLSRAGHTEAGCDLARLAGFEPAACIVEIMNENGTMARRPDLEQFAKTHQLKIGTIADLIQYRLSTEQTVHKRSVQQVQTRHGLFDLHLYEDDIHHQKHIALTMGSWQESDPIGVRVHVTDMLRDTLGIYSGSSWSLDAALEHIASEGVGALVILAQEESADLQEQLQALANDEPVRSSQNMGSYRTIGMGAQILRDLSVGKMRLLSSPLKFSGISGFNLEVVEFIGFDQKKSLNKSRIET